MSETIQQANSKNLKPKLQYLVAKNDRSSISNNQISQSLDLTDFSPIKSAVRNKKQSKKRRAENTTNESALHHPNRQKKNHSVLNITSGVTRLADRVAESISSSISNINKTFNVQSKSQFAEQTFSIFEIFDDNSQDLLLSSTKEELMLVKKISQQDVNDDKENNVNGIFKDGVKKDCQSNHSKNDSKFQSSVVGKRLQNSKSIPFSSFV